MHLNGKAHAGPCVDEQDASKIGTTGDDEAPATDHPIS
jgi:hypothetical protein